MAGSIARITSGRAMTAWMAGMNQRSDRHANGEVLNVMMRPMPRVAAETMRGSENSARGADAVAASRESGTQMQAATMAKASDVVITDCGETERAGNEPENIVHHALNENSLLTTRDL